MESFFSCSSIFLFSFLFPNVLSYTHLPTGPKLEKEKEKEKPTLRALGKQSFLSTIPQKKKAPVIAYGDSREITPPDRNQTILQWPPYGIGNGKKRPVIGRHKLGVECILHYPKLSSRNTSPDTVAKLAGFTYVRWQMGGSSASTISIEQHTHRSSPPATTALKGIVHYIRLGKTPPELKIPTETRPGHVCVAQPEGPE